MSTIPAGNSPLATYYNEARNYTRRRNHKIDTITIHCYVGQVTAKRGCDYFATTDRDASSNYVVGFDGSIGLSVPERGRSDCSSSSSNDSRAVTIEVASATSHPYAVTDKAYSALIALVADICKRNGIAKLVWSTSKNDRINHRNGCNMTVHRDFASKACPGQYLYDRHGQIAAAVNNRLAGIADGTPGFDPWPDPDVDTPEIDTPVKKDTIKLDITSIGVTKITANINTDSEVTKYNWSYKVSTLDNSNIISKKLSISSKNTTITVSGLIPNTAYYLEIIAEAGASVKIYSPRLLVCTKPDRPKSISNLKFELNNNLLNTTGIISFTPPDDWGEYSTDQLSRGYRVSLLINGKVKTFSDNLIIYGRSTTNIKIKLDTFMNDAIPRYSDTLQIGIQTWVKDSKNSYSFDNEYYPVCSDPVYLKSILNTIDKIYLKINNDFKQSVLYNNIKSK
jgi:hypothetical protein